MSMVQINAATIFDRFDELKKSVKASIAAQNNASTDRSAEILKKLENVEQKFGSLEAKVEKVVEENVMLKKELAVLKATVNQTRQANLNRNLIIKGIKEVEINSVETRELALKCIQKVDDAILATDILHAQRIGKAKDGKYRFLLVEFRHTLVRDHVLAMKKNLKVKAADISWNGNAFQEEPELIFFDEHLTRETHNLYMLARKLKQKGAAFVWIKHGRILVRPEENGKIENVWCIENLESLEVKLGRDQKKRRASSSPITETSSNGHTMDISHIEAEESHVNGSQHNEVRTQIQSSPGTRPQQRAWKGNRSHGKKHKR